MTSHRWHHPSDACFRGAVQPGIAIVTACRDRLGHLKRSMETWLACAEVTEIVVIDWSSADPIIDSLKGTFSDPRLCVVRAVGQDAWILTKAYNLGFRFAARTSICKADVDHLLHPAFFRRNRLTDDNFLAGDWRQARSENETHLNGLLFVRRKDFFGVCGYRETIRTYGWDDSDLYDRLVHSGLVRGCVALGSAEHLRHTDQGRVSTTRSGGFPQLEIQKNRCLSQVTVWDRYSNWANYEVEQREDGYFVCRQSEPDLPVARSLRAGCDACARRACGYPIAGRRWSDLGRAPVHFADRVLRRGGIELRRLGLRRAAIQRWRRAIAFRRAHHWGRARSLYIDVQHGLANRMRAYASAEALARATGRRLLLIWRPDHHCQCRFEDLFENPVEQVHTELDLDDFRRAGGAVVNCMSSEGGDIRVEIPDVRGDIYVRSAYELRSPLITRTRYRRALRSLRPRLELRQRLDPWDLRDVVGIHIRSVSDLDASPWDQSHNWTPQEHAELLKWRRRTQPTSFMPEIDRILASTPSQHFFLAADDPSVYTRFRERYSDLVTYVPRLAYDRSAEQIRSAVIDMFLLSRSKEILGSYYSGFSLVAAQIGGVALKLAGQDFGIDDGN